MSIRDIGKSIVEYVTPSGAPVLNQALDTVKNVGVAARTTFDTVNGAVNTIVNGASTSNASANSPTAVTKNLPSVLLNPLENFASYTPLWTMACLSPQEFNNPATYRGNPAALKNIVFSSAGRFDAQRVQTAHGVPEFYINNFIMKAVVAANKKTGNTNAISFDWDIYEPFSMGLLLQSLQVAAKNAGYVNYLNSAVYVLRLDIQGFDELGKDYRIIKPKFFVLKLTSCKFSVNEGGSTYKLTAVPYNHQGFSDTVNTAFNDVKLTAGSKGTVVEILRTGEESLVAVLNDIEKRLKDSNQISEVDEYDIEFPIQPQSLGGTGGAAGSNSATIDPNDPGKPSIGFSEASVISATSGEVNAIGNSSLGFDQAGGGNFLMKKNFERDEKTGLISRDSMTIDPKRRTFQFSQGQTLTSIINQVLVSSDYARDATDPKNKTPDGFIKWWRIDVQVQLKKFDPLIGDFARKFIYRVVPFLVHESIFSNPNSAPIGYQEIQKKICKGYNYIYTGQNTDIIKFDINIDNLYFAGINPSKESSAAKASDQNQGGPVETTNEKTSTGAGPAAGAQLASGGRARPKRNPDLLDKPVGGSGTIDTKQQVAEAFHKAFIDGSSADLINVNLEILGDPYWLVDSGMGNYFASPSSNPQITEDGTMNYEAGDVFVYLSFRTPVDISNVTGLYEFPNAAKESPFSGIYRVTACENRFNEGAFRQTLSLVRMPGQAIDYGGLPPEVNSTIKVDKAESSAVKVEEAEKPRSTINDEAIPSSKKVIT